MADSTTGPAGAPDSPGSGAADRATRNAADDRSAAAAVDAELVADLASDLQEVAVPAEVIPKILALVQARIHHYALPQTYPTRELEELQRLGIPDAAERYFRKWEQVTDGNERRADRVTAAQIALRFAGLFCGFLIALALIGGAVYTAVQGHTAVALALLGVSAAGMVTAFLQWRPGK